MLVVEIAHIVIGIYILLLTLRMFVKSRDAYFNPLFGGVYKATEPIMAPIQKALYRKPRDLDKADYSVFLPIVALIIIDGLVLGFFTNFGVHRAVLFRFLGFVDNVFQFFVVLVLIFGFFYQFSRFPANPFLRGAYKIMEPAYILVGKLGQFFRDHSGVFLFVIGFVVHFLLASVVLSLLYGPDLQRYSETPHIVALMFFAHSFRVMLSLVVFFSYLVIASALMSWINPDPGNPVVQLIHLLTDPLNRPFRKIVPNIGGMDISPIFTILALQFVAQAGYKALALMMAGKGGVL